MGRSNVTTPVRSVALALALLCASSVARAEPTEHDKGRATALFNDAKSLLGEGKIPEACRKLEESRRLDPLPGTILNLASCHDKEGLLASAFAEYREARALAERDGRADRVAFAEEHMRAIEPRISQLVIVVPAEAVVADLRVTCDGAPLARAAWGGRIPVDPGEHVVEASAPGKKTARSTVKVGREGDVQELVVAALEDERSLPPPIAVVPAPAPEAKAKDVSAPPQPPSTGLSTRRTIAIVTAGVGVVGLGVGTFFGLQAIDKHGDPAATCTTTPCSVASITLNEEAKFAADAATVSFAVGLLSLGGAAFLWFGETPPRASARVRVTPSLGAGDGRVVVSGAF